MRNQTEIAKELKEIERQVRPLETRRWRLWAMKAKVEASDFLDSKVLSQMHWRIRSYGSNYSAYLQFDNRYPVPESIEKIVPFPHSHVELAKGLTLNQDDGDITLTFGSPNLVLKYIKLLNLPIIEWVNLTDLIMRLKQYNRLEKYLKAKVVG